MGAGHRATLATRGRLRVRVSRVPAAAAAAAAVVMLRKGGTAAVHSVHGLQGQKSEVKGQVVVVVVFLVLFCFL